MQCKIIWIIWVRFIIMYVWFSLQLSTCYVTPHCWGHQVQKVDTGAKFYVILFSGEARDIVLRQGRLAQY